MIQAPGRDPLEHRLDQMDEGRGLVEFEAKGAEGDLIAIVQLLALSGIEPFAVEKRPVGGFEVEQGHPIFATHLE